jgi:SAM-dependent methyltransferase
MLCIFCFSTSRKRSFVKALLRVLSPSSSSLNEARADLLPLSIYSAATRDHFYRFFGVYSKNYTSSEYIDGVLPGSYQDGVLCQDVESLTFQNEQFDVVVTEDVFEHLRHPYKALQEIYRVLKPSGYYIFTVPMSYTKKTVVRVDTSTETDVCLEPKVYHEDPLRGGILVYNDFGYDFLDRLAEVGFTTEVHISSYLDTIAFGTADGYVLVCRK